MTTQTKQPQSIFPDYPRDQPVVDKNGNLVDAWDTQLNSLFQALQSNFKNEGILFPPLTEDQMDTIEALYNPFIGFPLPQNNPSVYGQTFLPDISGQTAFDTTNRVPKQFIITFDASPVPLVLTATWKTFTLT